MHCCVLCDTTQDLLFTCYMVHQPSKGYNLYNYHRKYLKVKQKVQKKILRISVAAAWRIGGEHESELNLS